MLASLSHATSLTQSPGTSLEDEEDGVAGPSGKASFTSQRSDRPFTAKRDKSFADVQRFLGDSLSKSASKGMSFAKQLQVSLSGDAVQLLSLVLSGCSRPDISLLIFSCGTFGL